MKKTFQKAVWLQDLYLTISEIPVLTAIQIRFNSRGMQRLPRHHGCLLTI